MIEEIKAHLTQQLQTLKAFQQLLEREANLLIKGSSDAILAMVHEKQSYIRLLNELEAKRLQLVKQKTFQELMAEFPQEMELQTLYEQYQICTQQLKRLIEENEQLTNHAYQVSVERMAFYTDLVREAKSAQQTYARGGQYQKATSIGSTIIERTL